MSYYPNNHNPDVAMVNYTTATTSVANENYLSETVVSDSLSFMIKNKTIYKFDLVPDFDQNELDK